MPPRKTQTIKEVMKESKPIIDQKLGTTRSKKVKKNESDNDSDYGNTSNKQKKSNQSQKMKISKESLHSDDSQDKLSPELKPSSLRQQPRTKGEKIQDKNNTKKDEVKAKQENQNQNFDNQNLDKLVNQINDDKDQKLNQDNLQKQQELSDKDNNINKEQQLNQIDNNSKDHKENIKQNEQVIPQIIITAPESEIKKNQSRQEEEEEKEQLEKQLKITVDIVFCCDVNLLDCSRVDSLKNTIEFIIKQIKQNEKCSTNIKFSIVRFNDIIMNQKLQSCQVIDLCDENEILQNLDEIKQMGQVEIQKGLYYGLKLATSTTKWRKESNTKSFRYIIHIANQQLQIDNQSEELEYIIQEMNNKNIRYKYLRIDQKIDLDFDGKQYLQNNLKSYEESFLKEFGNLKNVVSGIILRELLHENNK